MTTEMPDLSGVEQACLELAREPLCRGSYPVGAVLLDDAGQIRAQGEAGLAGGRLAHAGLFEIAQQGLSWPPAAAELLRAG